MFHVSVIKTRGRGERERGSVVVQSAVTSFYHGVQQWSWICAAA